MSHFDLRDISQRLAASRDPEAVVQEFLGYLQSARQDWAASLAFYEVSRDALVKVYHLRDNRLLTKQVAVPVDRLPPRLVRKFFHPNAFSNAATRRSTLATLFQGSPAYEPDPLEAPALQPLSPATSWRSCICLPLTDQDDLLGMVMLVSEKSRAFPRKVVDELLPLKNIAALALAQHLYRTARQRPPSAEEAVPAAAEFQDRIRRLNAQTATRAQENDAKARKLQALAAEIELLDKSSSRYQHELDQVKQQLFALEEQSMAATQHLHEAYSQIQDARTRAGALRRTVDFVRDVFELLSQEHDGRDFSRTLVAWFCEQFTVDRCSLMWFDEAQEILRIGAHRGIDPGIAGAAKVRIGQGIAGWVAQNRKPLFVRVENESTDVRHTHQDAYNSASFISVPLVYRNRLIGVLNLSNKRSGAEFDELDLDRALIAGSILAVTLHGSTVARRAAA